MKSLISKAGVAAAIAGAVVILSGCASTSELAEVRAMAEQARIHTIGGRYAEAAALYEQLVDEAEEDPAGQEVYAVRLGEVRAIERFGAVAAAALPVAPEPTASPIEVPVDSGGQDAEEAPASDGAPGDVDEPAS